MRRVFAWLPTKVFNKQKGKRETIWLKFFYREFDYVAGLWVYYNFLPCKTSELAFKKYFKK